MNQQSIQEKIKAILEEKGIVVKDFGSNLHKEQNELQKTIQEGKLHYDKDDFTDFGSLFLSKPISKGCQDMGFDHPTVI